jgi:hypothetical protein
MHVTRHVWFEIGHLESHRSALSRLCGNAHRLMRRAVDQPCHPVGFRGSPGRERP